ncbi:MAG: hypothetical protein N3G80_01310 [Candidatus Micrarchaeota archaeon]|nr:hypothetical protein [Candidatus Micrarchaeota archaeon]
MKILDLLSVKGLSFLLLFVGVAIISSSINFSQVLGGPKNQTFTFFQFVGPIAGGFLGAGVGALSVLLAQAVSFITLGSSAEPITFLRFLPMIFATIYFAKYSKGKLHSAVVPLLCMIAFILHPVGGQAWFYSLYWLIPALVLLVPENLFARSLGATFTAHSIGSIIWLYSFPSTPEFWIALIPIVAFERLLFACGISASFVAFNTVLARVETVAKSGMLHIDKRYVLFAKN